MYPNAANTTLSLLNVVSKLDSLGNKRLAIKSSKEVVGIAKSITSSEFQTSTLLQVNYDFKVAIQTPLYNGSKYALIHENYYKIQRTFVNGQFIELYMVLTELKKEDFYEDKP